MTEVSTNHEPTEHEKAVQKEIEIEQRNGWTDKTLQEYLRKRTADKQRQLDPTTRTRERPYQQQNQYNPRRWR